MVDPRRLRRAGIHPGGRGSELVRDPRLRSGDDPSYVAGGPRVSGVDWSPTLEDLESGTPAREAVEEFLEGWVVDVGRGGYTYDDILDRLDGTSLLVGGEWRTILLPGSTVDPVYRRLDAIARKVRREFGLSRRGVRPMNRYDTRRHGGSPAAARADRADRGGSSSGPRMGGTLRGRARPAPRRRAEDRLASPPIE